MSKTTLAPLAAQALVLIVMGFVLDGAATVSQPTLFWAFLAASLMGVLSSLALIWDRDRPWYGHLGVIAVAALVWRLAYFPHLVFAGFVAALGEAAVHAIAPGSAVIYPVFLLAVAALHLVCLLPLGLAFGPRPESPPETLWARLRHPPRALVVVLAVPALAVASMVSCSTTDDLTLLPDRPWSAEPTLPPPGIPGENPYMEKALESDRALPPRVLLLCAGMTYPLIPHSPWAHDVKGTLSDLTHANPHATTADRLAEHHLAYIVAHRRLHEDAP